MSEENLAGPTKFRSLVESGTWVNPEGSFVPLSAHERHGIGVGVEALAKDLPYLLDPLLCESPDIKVGRSSANRHNLRGVSSPSVIE